MAYILGIYYYYKNGLLVLVGDPRLLPLVLVDGEWGPGPDDLELVGMVSIAADEDSAVV